MAPSKSRLMNRPSIQAKCRYPWRHGATHIVKAFDTGEYPELAANEMICTHGAAAAGIQTSRVELSENRLFLIVDRLDLTEH